ncbi:MAG: O-antigen ligase family protein, partial [Cetobacterium sp.]
KILESMIIVITTVLLVITQSRGMYIALPTALLFSIFIKKRKYFFILIIIFGLSFPIVNNKFSDNVYLARFKSISSTSDVSINSRYEVMNESIRLFKKNPINGIGYENFMELQDNSNYKYNYKYHHAHNMAIKMLGETGIIGFVGYFFMLGTIFIHSLKRAREKIEYLILLTATTILAIYENFELIIHGNHAYPILFFIIAVVINEEYESRKNKLEVKQ